MLAALAVATTSLLATSTPAHAAATVDRISGGDRYETGAAVSADAFPDPSSVDVAYLATGENFADALSAGAAAFTNAGPVVLTTPGALHVAARDELRRLQPDRVVVVGGPVAISQGVIDAVKGDAAIGASEVTRIGGGTRYDTAANVVTDAFPDPVSTVFIATGQEFPDALSGVPAAARYEAPLLLTEHGSLPEATRDALADLQPDRIVILGGEVAISREVENELGAFAGDIDRLAGGDRFGTGVAVSKDAFVGARTVYVATGRNFPDALAGGPGAGVNAGPLLLTETSSLPDAVASELLRLNPRRVVILGGPNAITDDVRNEIRRVLSGGTALPSGQTPDLAFATVDNRPDQPTTGYQVINLGTFEGDYEALTNPGEDFKDIDPLMSPDGRRLVFDRFAAGNPSDADPWIIDVAVGAGSTRKLFDVDNRFEASGGCTMDDLTWAPSGNQLAFICTGRQNDDGSLPWRAHVVDMRGRIATIALPETADATGLAYSPDGSRLAVAMYDSGAPSAAERSRIVAVDPSAPGEGIQGPIALVPMDGSFPEIAGQLHWSGDGSTIVGRWGSPYRNQLLVVDATTGGTNLTMAEAEHEVSGVTDDGSQALVVTHGTDTDLLRMKPTNGGGPTTIADGANLENGQIWNASLDGTRVVYDDMNSRSLATEAQVWLSNVEGSSHTKLFDIDGVLSATPSLNSARDGAAVDERDDER